MNKKLILPQHIGNGLYMLDNGYSIEIAVNHHENVVAILDRADYQTAIDYITRCKKQ